MPWAGHTARYAIPEIYEAIKRAQDDAALRQHAQPGGAAVPGTVADQRGLACRSRCITARSTSASAGGSRRRWRATACAPSSPPRRSTSASTGAMSTSSSMSARRRAPAGWRSASAAPTTAWTSRRKAILVPANRFEVLECRAALDANYLGAQDTPPLLDGALDVLCAARARHGLRRAVRCRRALRGGHAAPRPTAELDRRDLRPRRRFRRDRRLCAAHLRALCPIRRTKDGLWRVANPRVAQQYRLNVGTIVEAPMLNVRYVRPRHAASSARGGPVLGKIEEYFLETLTHGDTFLFAGQVLRFEGIRENECFVSNAAGRRCQGARSMPAASSRSRPISPTRCAACWPTRERWKSCPSRSPTGCACRQRKIGAAAARRPAGRDLSARQPLLHGRLSLRGPAGAPDARHAADPAAGAGRRPAARLRRHRLFAGRLGAGRHGRACSRPGSRRWPPCSTRTCWATISRPGWPTAGC